MVKIGKVCAFLFFLLFFVVLEASNQQDLSLLSGLTDNGGQAQQEALSKEKKANELRKEKELNFLQGYYGNPKYQEAMSILNNAALRNQYQQLFTDLSLFFLNYANQSFQDSQTSSKVKAKATDSSSLLNSLTQPQSNNASASKNKDNSSQDSSSLLDSLTQPQPSNVPSSKSKNSSKVQSQPSDTHKKTNQDSSSQDRSSLLSDLQG